MKSHPRARLTRRGPLASTSSFHIPDFCWNTNSERCSPCRMVFTLIPLTLTQKNVKTALCGRAMITLGTQNAEVAAQVGERSPKASPTAPFWEACRETHRPALAWHRRRRRETAAKGRISGPGLAPGSCDSVRTRRSAHPAERPRCRSRSPGCSCLQLGAPKPFGHFGDIAAPQHGLRGGTGNGTSNGTRCHTAQPPSSRCVSGSSPELQSEHAGSGARFQICRYQQKWRCGTQSP